MFTLIADNPFWENENSFIASVTFLDYIPSHTTPWTFAHGWYIDIYCISGEQEIYPNKQRTTFKGFGQKDGIIQQMITQ